jgi:hypothetical protein
VVGRLLECPRLLIPLGPVAPEAFPPYAHLFASNRANGIVLRPALTPSISDWSGASSGLRPSVSFCRLEDRFKKSLSMSGEVSSLAGDRVVSHERSRPADLPRRADLRPRHAGSNPSHYCGGLYCCALLAHGRRCRNAVTARNVNSIMYERGQYCLTTNSLSGDAVRRI